MTEKENGNSDAEKRTVSEDDRSTRSAGGGRERKRGLPLPQMRGTILCMITEDHGVQKPTMATGLREEL